MGLSLSIPGLAGPMGANHTQNLFFNIGRFSLKKLLTVILFLPLLVFAETAVSVNSIPFNFANEDITKVIETYAKASGVKFVIDPGVRGKITIINAQPIGIDEAYNDLSAALAVNGFAVSKRENTFVIMSARNVQRSLVEVTTELPSLKPERMVTWVVTLKNTPANNINRDLRILTSKDGELSVNSSKNQLIFTDWTSNLHRIGEMLKQIDVPADPQLAKFVNENNKTFDQKAEVSRIERVDTKTPGKMESKTTTIKKSQETSN